MATYDKKHLAPEVLEQIFWDNVNKKKDDEGYITSRGLKVEYDNCNVSTRKFYLPSFGFVYFAATSYKRTKL